MMWENIKLSLLFFWLVFFFGPNLQAQNLIRYNIDAPFTTYSVNASYGLEISQSREDVVEDLSSSMSILLSLTRDSDKAYALMSIAYDQQLATNDNRVRDAGEFRDPYFELGTPIDGIPLSTLKDQNLSLSASLATSEVSRELGKKTSLGVAYSFVYDLLGALSYMQSQSLVRSFYSLEIAPAGTINNPWSYRLANRLSYTVNKNIIFLASLSYDLRRSFFRVLKDSVSTDFRFSYTWADQLSIYSGIASSGMATTGADGRGTEIRLLDETRPILYVGLSGSF